ncbi:ATP-binding protein [Streptomyces sp. F001]|uniref:ATP-binding protein n=1 Tax=Streptomyces sp. F001 TaxID=1510026 RepID=UPI00101E48CB|nr:ATP-binding protein [Streptomyces sp. F001]RZB13667.1 ATP-binding protein [Streptomyces sp. F001]
MMSSPRYRNPAPDQAVLVADAPGQVGLRLTGPDRAAVVALSAEPAAVGLARHWTTGLLGMWGLSADDRSTAALVISELATNAVRYGHSEMTIRLFQRADRLYMCVTDSGVPSVAHRRTVRKAFAEHGRGLAIVHALAESIEVSREPDGWRVGAVLRVTTAVNAAAGSAAGGA